MNPEFLKVLHDAFKQVCDWIHDNAMDDEFMVKLRQELTGVYKWIEKKEGIE